MIRLHLAPMEGVVDFIMRDFLTSMGGVDHCVTEFIRVVDRPMPDFVLHRYCPELKMGSKTRSGVPVFIQLLGGQAQPLAETAALACELGALGIDLNFGCPAKTVNRHDGGATLLKCSQRLFDIVSTVRKAVPKSTPVTAKIRLGFDDPSACLENAKAIESAGAEWLTVHCRTKTDGYKPPAYWEWIPRIKEVVKLPVVANGEIFTVQDFKKCLQVTNCDQFMIGRGGIADPTLFRQIKNEIQMSDLDSWIEVRTRLPEFYQTCETQVSAHFAQARTKQWLRQLVQKHESAKPIFDELKIQTDPQAFKSRLQQICGVDNGIDLDLIQPV